MGAPKWMQDVADSMIPDISGRKKAAAQAAQDKAAADQAAAEAKAKADAAAAAKKAGGSPSNATSDNPAGLSFKKGGIVKAPPNFSSTKPPAGDRKPADAGKAMKAPPPSAPGTFGKPKNTVPSNNGYKAGGMVRRGYGKARGA